VRLYYSGGSPIPETNMAKPDIMLSMYVDAKNGKPNARMRAIFAAREKAQKEKKRGKGRK